MAKPKLPNLRTTTWRPTPQDDHAAQVISSYLSASLGQDVGHTGAIRFALRFVAEALEPAPQAGTEPHAA